MKTKKVLVFFGVTILGALIATTIDQILGINFEDVGISTGAHLAHNVTYMLWGAIIIAAIKKPNNQTGNKEEK